MRSWLPLGLVAVALLVGGSACGSKQSKEASGDWMLAFQGEQNGEWATFAVDLDGHEAVRISGNEAPNWMPPIPSPDGKSVILPELSGLVVMRTDGSGKRPLADGAVEPAWSPDGAELAFVGRQGGISISDVDGRHVRRLTESEYDSDPTWSPDGRRIAFIRDYALLVVDADGGHERELTDEAAEPHWSPDGTSISFVEWESGPLVTVSADDGHVLSRAPRPGADLGYAGPAWSPDGGQIAYTQRGPHGSHITVMNTDGTGARMITSPSEWAGAPLWSPDGRSIVYARGTSQGDELWEIRLEDRKTRRLTALYPNGVNVVEVGAGWIKGPVTPTQAPEPKVLARKDGAVLENPQPISHLAASGSLVAAVPPERLFGSLWVLTPPLLLWDPEGGKLERLSLAACRAGTGVALNRERAGYACLGGHGCCIGSSVQAWSFEADRPTSYFTGAAGDGVPDQALAGRIAGDGDSLYFTERTFDDHGNVTARKLWRVGARGKTVIATGADAGEPAAADGDTLAVERDDGVVALLDSDGRVKGRIAPGGGIVTDPPTFDSFPPATIDLDGADLVVLRDGLLQHYDARSLKLVRSRRVSADAQLGGLADGIVAYAAGNAVHVLRLEDGAEALIPVRGGHVDAADLTTAGLFYAVNTQSVRNDYVEISKNAPSSIVFIRWKALLQRLR